MTSLAGDSALKELCRLYVSRTVECEYCGNQRSVKAARSGLVEDHYLDLLEFEAQDVQIPNLAEDSRPPDELLLQPPEFVETAKVVDMLLAVPKYGRVKVNKVLVQCRISPSKTIGGLSQRQRTELVSMLRR